MAKCQGLQQQMQALVASSRTLSLEEQLLGCPGTEVDGSMVNGSVGWDAYGPTLGDSLGLQPTDPFSDFQRDIQVPSSKRT